MLGHELRNPLATLTNAMNVIDDTHAVDDAVGGEYQEIIRRQLGNLSRLVDDLLDVSRITSGKVAPRARRPRCAISCVGRQRPSMGW